MKINIEAKQLPLTEALLNYAERRLRSTLSCCDEHIQKVIMQLSDINRPRGGEAKSCYLQVVLPGLSNVAVRDIEADIYVAIDRASDRAGRTVMRKLDRKQT